MTSLSWPYPYKLKADVEEFSSLKKYLHLSFKVKIVSVPKEDVGPECCRTAAF
jgi:hypothetical protein